MVGFIMGIKTFQSEYNTVPTEALSNHNETTPRWTRGAILSALIGTDAKMNPRHIHFFDPLIARNKRNGFYTNDSGVPVLADPWGTPYFFAMDLNNDGKIPNPDPRDNKSKPFLDAPIIMFSAGPDRDPNTWDDNVLSWK